MVANDLGHCDARLRNAIATDQRLTRGLVGCGGMHLPAAQDGKPQCGVADGARHHHAVAGLGPAAMNHLARRYAAECGDRYHQRSRRRHSVPAQQWAGELRGILAQCRRERF